MKNINYNIFVINNQALMYLKETKKFSLIRTKLFFLIKILR